MRHGLLFVVFILAACRGAPGPVASPPRGTRQPIPRENLEADGAGLDVDLEELFLRSCLHFSQRHETSGLLQCGRLAQRWYISFAPPTYGNEGAHCPAAVEVTLAIEWPEGWNGSEREVVTRYMERRGRQALECLRPPAYYVIRSVRSVDLR